MTNKYTDSFAYRATGVLGKKRDAMLKNELHARPELAKTLQRGYSLPEGATYGMVVQTNDGGVTEALTNWVGGGVHGDGRLVYRKPMERFERDFVGLNRAAVMEGFVSAKEHNIYRATHDLKRSVQIKNEDFITTNEPEIKFTPRRIPPNMVFGVPTRPSTPLFDLLEHKYQDRWIDERRKLNKMYREEREAKKAALLNPYQNRTSMLRQAKVPAEKKDLWKLPTFRNAQPALDTTLVRKQTRRPLDVLA